jgi:hypothetical protein
VHKVSVHRTLGWFGATGHTGFRNRIPEGNHHTTLIRLSISLATAFITVKH